MERVSAPMSPPPSPQLPLPPRQPTIAGEDRIDRALRIALQARRALGSEPNGIEGTEATGVIKMVLDLGGEVHGLRNEVRAMASRFDGMEASLAELQRTIAADMAARAAADAAAIAASLAADVAAAAAVSVKRAPYSRIAWTALLTAVALVVGGLLTTVWSYAGRLTLKPAAEVPATPAR